MFALLIFFAFQADAVKPGATEQASQRLPKTTDANVGVSTEPTAKCQNELENFWQELRAIGVQVPDNGHQTGAFEAGSSRGEVKFLMDFVSAYLPWKKTDEDSSPVICQSGFNYGSSAFAFLCGSTEANAKLISFDLGSHEYVSRASEHILSKFPQRHTLVLGNSKQTIPAFPQKRTCDIVFVDGGRDEHTAMADIKNFGSIAKPAAALIVDDCHSEDGSPASRAWDEAKDKNIVSGSPRFHEFEGGRSICLGNYHKNLLMPRNTPQLQVTNSGSFLSLPKSSRDDKAAAATATAAAIAAVKR